MDAQACEIARSTAMARNMRDRAGHDTADLHPALGVALGVVLSLVGWAVVMALLLKGI